MTLDPNEVPEPPQEMKERNTTYQKTKLNFIEKLQVKSLIKKARKKIKQYKKKTELQAKERETLEIQILEMAEILDIEIENNGKTEKINKENIKHQTNNELEEGLETCLDELRKLI